MKYTVLRIEKACMTSTIKIECTSAAPVAAYVYEKGPGNHHGRFKNAFVVVPEGTRIVGGVMRYGDVPDLYSKVWGVIRRGARLSRDEDKARRDARILAIQLSR